METKKRTKEEVVKALKLALQHKEEALKRTQEQFASEGIKGKVVCL